MNEILFKLLEQTPVVVVMGLGLYALWNDGKTKEKSFSEERKQHKDELKERNDYIQKRDIEMRDTLKDVIVLQEAIKESLNDLESKIDNINL
jgi:hypothetical protein